MASLEQQHHRRLAEGLYSMYMDNILTDVILEVENEQIHCHRNVLAASSAYFRAMFTNPVRERDEKRVYLHDIGFDILKSVIGYMYTGNITVTNENVQDVIISANMLELEHLIGYCAEHMTSEICIANCVDIYLFASHFACQRLKSNARAYLIEHFADVIQENDKISSVDIDDFEDIISSDDLGVDKEEMVYTVMIKWLEGENRQSYLPRLFKHVRLSLIDEHFFNNHIMHTNCLLNNPECRHLLDMFSLYKIKSSAEVNVQETETVTANLKLEDFEFNAKPRHGMFNRKMLIFSSGANGVGERSFTAFDPVTLKNYNALKPHPTFDFKFKVDYFQLVTTVENDILFIGGIFYDNHHFEDHGAALRDVLQYNMRDVIWEKKACMNTARCWFSATVYYNSVYVIGGKPTYPRGEPTDSVEIYSSEADTWIPVSPLPIKLYAHSSSAVRDVIYVFGGKDEDDDFLDTVFRYDIPSDSWTLVTTKMAKPRAQLTSFCYKSNIYLVGGISLHENILTVGVYNPDRNSWSHGQDFPEERKIIAASMSDGTIFVCGGMRHLGVSGRRSRRQIESRDLYKYDIAKDCWTKVVKLVQYGNTQSTSVAVLNTKYLDESDFVSLL